MLRPNADAGPLAQAQRCLAAGDVATAQMLCRQVLERTSKNADAWALAAQIAMAKNQMPIATSYLLEYVKLRPKDAQGQARLGHALLQSGRRREAMARFDRALKLHPNLSWARLGKARAFCVRGQFQKAKTLLDSERKAGRGTPELQCALAEAELGLGNLDRSIELTTQLMDRADIPPDLRCHVASLLGRAHERTTNFDEAFQAYEAMNRAQPGRFAASEHGARIEALIDAFSPEAFATFARSSITSDLPIFIVGMPRCGSTLVERILDMHPKVHGAGEAMLIRAAARALPDEIESTTPYPACVSEMLAAQASAIAQVQLEALRSVGRHAGRVVDKGLHNHEHLGLLTLLHPAARIIHCRRDPLDTCFSCFATYLSSAAHPYITDLADLGVAYRAYDQIMHHWRDTLGIPIHEVVYEELVTDPERVVRDLLDYCGLDWHEACLRYHEKERAVLTASAEQVREPIYDRSVGRAGRFREHLGPLIEVLGPDLAR